jgi:hypothetical protein
MLYRDDVSIRSYAAERAPELDPQIVLDTVMEMFGDALGRSWSVIVVQIDGAIARIRDGT